MTTISADQINPFLLSTSAVFKQICASEVKIGKPYLRDAGFGSDLWLIVIGITGQMMGQVSIGLENKVACDVASKMCCMPIVQMDEISSSAICELANMIMGNAATVFSSQGIGIDITPPKLTQGHDGAVVKSICIPMSYDKDKTIELSLSIKNN